MKYDGVFFGSGGAKCFIFFGALRAAVEQGVLNLEQITSWGGASAGSLVALLFSLGMSIDKATSLMLNLDLDKLFGGNTTKDPFEFGLKDGNRFDTLVRELLQESYQVDDLSFRDLRERTGRTLLVQATNLTKHRPQLFGPDTDPDMSVTKAIRMSVSLPFIFVPVTHENNLYVDGGMLRNHMADPTCLSFVITNEFTESHAPQSLLEYAMELVMCITYGSSSAEERRANVIELSVLSDGLVLVLDDTTRRWLVESGYQQTMAAIQGSRKKQNFDRDEIVRRIEAGTDEELYQLYRQLHDYFCVPLRP